MFKRQLMRSFAIQTHTMAAVLVTGASGLIGSHILLELISKGYPVRALSRNISRSSAFISKLLVHYDLSLELIDRVTWIEGDLRNAALYEPLLDSIETVFHCAGIVSTASFEQAEMNDVNVRATADLVNYCLQSPIKWFGHMSSVASLGPNPDGLVDEDFFWKNDKNQSAYALSKYLSEQEVWRAKEEGLPVFILNPSVVVGPGQIGSSSFSKLIAQLKKGLPFYLSGSSGFVDVRDLATFSVLQWQKNEQGKRVIVSAENRTQLAFFQSICKCIGVSAPTYRANKLLYNLASMFERLAKLGNARKCNLHSDLYKMGTSKNRYDNGKSISMGATYRSLEDSIQNALAFDSI